jgi:hypothetical protein
LNLRLILARQTLPLSYSPNSVFLKSLHLLISSQPQSQYPIHMFLLPSWCHNYNFPDTGPI